MLVNKNATHPTAVVLLDFQWEKLCDFCPFALLELY